MAEYAADPRTNKIDLGVGVYKDDKNNTPIMSAVKKAEQRIHDAARTKTYKGVVGNKEFFAGLRHGPVPGDGPEIQQVMIVQPIHMALGLELGKTLYIGLADNSNPFYLF
jgi:aspartate/tyrosine/aromatic aminotransferase